MRCAVACTAWRLAGPDRPSPRRTATGAATRLSRGVTQVAGQTLRVGFANRHTLVDIDVHETEYHVYDQAGEPLALIPEPAAWRAPAPRATASATTRGCEGSVMVTTVVVLYGP